jgi:hypothetical protein
MNYRLPWIIGKLKKGFQSERHWLQYPLWEVKVAFSANVKASVILTFATVGRTTSSVTANVTLEIPVV